MLKKHLTIFLTIYISAQNSENASNSSEESSEQIKMRCKEDFLNAYNIDGEKKVKYEKMLLCPDINFNCCSPFDEMKFHKNWFNFYKPKLETTHERAIKRYQKLSPFIEFFKSFDFDKNESKIIQEHLLKAKELLVTLKKIEFDAEMRPIINEMPKLLKFETEMKKSFLCVLCDYSNHEYLNSKDKKILFKKNYCEIILDKYSKSLQIRTKLLNPILLIGHKFMNLFDVDYYNKNNRELIIEVRKNIDKVYKCYPDERAKYNHENCKDICDSYSISSLDEMFYGEFSFYEYVLDKFEKFKEWVEKEEEVLEAKNEEVEEEVEEEEEERKLRLKNSKFKRKNKKKIRKKNHGRILSAFKHSSFSVKKNKKKFISEKMEKLSRSLKKYKGIINELKNKNIKYLKKILKNSKKAAYKKKEEKKRYHRSYKLRGRLIDEEIRKLKEKRKHLKDKNKKYRFLNEGAVVQPEEPKKEGEENPKEGEEKSVEEEDEYGNFNCTESQAVMNCTNSTKISNVTLVLESINITDSKNITNSTNITNSVNITNCLNITNSTNLTNSNYTSISNHSEFIYNSTNITHSTNTTLSENVTNSHNCTLCINCINCENSYNITNGVDIKNVTNATDIKNVENGINLKNVTDSLNVINLTNALNMTNATDASDCWHNYNCTGKKCNIPRISDDRVKEMIDKKIHEHSEMIIDRLYDLYRNGDVKNYEEDETLFDLSIFKANSVLNDIDHFEKSFDKDGISLDYRIGSGFVPDPEVVKEKALEDLINKKDGSENNEFFIVQDEDDDVMLNDKVVKQLNEEEDMLFVFDFLHDVKREVMSYDFVKMKIDEELELEDKYEQHLDEEVHHGEEGEGEAVEGEVKEGEGEAVEGEGEAVEGNGNAEEIERTLRNIHRKRKKRKTRRRFRLKKY